MVLKGLTCHHMIVITYGEGEAGEEHNTQHNETEAENRMFPLVSKPINMLTLCHVTFFFCMF